MSTGLFRTSTAQGLGARAYQRKRAAQTLDDFADLLAQGIDPQHAACQLGFTPKYGTVLLSTIRKKLGWQAQ